MCPCMLTHAITRNKQPLGQLGALLLLLAVLLSVVAPAFSPCHDGEINHNECAAVHGCCPNLVPALTSTSTTFLTAPSPNISVLNNDLHNTGVAIPDAPFHPPRA